MVTCPATPSSYKSEKKIADGKSEKLLREYYKRDERWEYEVRWLLDSRRDVTAVLEVLGNRGSKICAKKLNAFFFVELLGERLAHLKVNPLRH